MVDLIAKLNQVTNRQEAVIIRLQQESKKLTQEKSAIIEAQKAQSDQTATQPPILSSGPDVS
jgi:hypothetical protein